MPDSFSKHYSGFVRYYSAKVNAYLETLAHSGQKGTVAESAVGELLRDFLPRKFTVSENVVLLGVDQALSPQIDIAIVDDLSLPRMFPLKAEVGMHPVDACIGVVEVKSRASKADVADAFSHAKKIKSMKYNRVALPLSNRRKHWGHETPVEADLRRHYTIALPPIHILWCWETLVDTMEGASRWVAECLSGCDLNEVPDMILFLDKGFLWDRFFVLADQRTAQMPPEQVMQAGYFEAGVGEPVDAEVRVLPRQNLVSRVSRGRALLNFLWTLLPKLDLNELNKHFDPASYIRAELKTMKISDIGGSLRLKDHGG